MNDICEEERWATVPRFDGYRFSSFGRIQSEWRSRGLKGGGRHKVERYKSGQWKEIKAILGNQGYLQVCLREESPNRFRITVHKLILEAFVGPRPDGMECRHIDGNKTNCRLDNLAWGTALENAQDRVRHGTNRIGTRNHNAKLDDDRVLQILQWRMCRMTFKKIADLAGISPKAARNICVGRTWKHVPRPNALGNHQGMVHYNDR